MNQQIGTGFTVIGPHIANKIWHCMFPPLLGVVGEEERRERGREREERGERERGREERERGRERE